MRRIFFIIQKEFRQVFRDKPMLAILFIMPLIQLIILGYAITTDIRNISMLVSDYDNSTQSRELIQKFRNSGYFIISGNELDRGEVRKRLDHSEVSIAVTIPHNFAADIRRKQQPQIQILADGVDSNSSLVAVGYATEILRSFLKERLHENLMSNPALAKRVHSIDPKIRIWYNPNLEATHYMVPGIIVLLLTIVTTMLTALGLVREKEIGTLEQLMVTPIQSQQLIIGKTVPFAILGFFEISFAILVARIYYGIHIEGNLAVLALFAFIFVFTTLGLGIFISTASKTQQQAMFMAWFMIIFAILMSGFLFPIENMPKVLQYMTYINPVRYFITTVRELFLKGSGLAHLWPQGLTMLCFSLVIMTMSAIRFQKRIK
ncbi:MAG: ABC transporter permease [candidate division KSB1 bacterium]|jgi:ABC-2 type transport system permease protein|nr:ABC transporter permease [candidate division KSB1 bacterium]